MHLHVRRRILEEMLDEDVKDTCDAARSRLQGMEEPEKIRDLQTLLKVRGCNRKDWKDHLKGFNKIKSKARRMKAEEWVHYKRMIHDHEILAALKFGVELPYNSASHSTADLTSSWWHASAEHAIKQQLAKNGVSSARCTRNGCANTRG